MYTLDVWECSLGGLAGKPQSMASRCPKLSKRGQMPTRTLRVKSRRRKGDMWMERSHGRPKCASREMWREGYQCGLRKGEMKSRTALQQATLKDVEMSPRYAPHWSGKESGNDTGEMQHRVFVVLWDLTKNETLFLKLNLRIISLWKDLHSLLSEVSSTHLCFIPVLILALQF